MSMRIERRVGWVLAAANVAFILVATLTPVPHATPPHFERHCYVCGAAGGVDVLLNLLLFMPLGFGLGLARRRWWVPLLVCGGLSAFVETMQLLVIPGRDSSLSDLFNNTTGGMMGFALVAVWRSLVWPRPHAALRLALAATAAWLAITAATAEAMRPEWFGPATARLRSSDADFANYPGAVFGGAAAGVRLRPTGPDSLYTPSPGRDVVVAPGTPLSAWVDVTVGRETEAIAPAIGVYIGSKGRIVLGEERRALFFAVPLRASRVRLRHPLITLSDVFPSSDGRSGAVALGDTIRLWGALSGDTLRAAAMRLGGPRRRASEALVASQTLVLSPFLGWTTILFWNPHSGPAADAALTALWVGALLLPCGYWSARAWPATRWSAAVPVVALVAGVVIVPAVARYSPAGWFVWAGSAAGVVAGALLASVVERVGARHAARQAGTATAAPV